MGNRVQRFQTNISEPQMAQAIIEAWKDLFGNVPTKEQVSMVLAQNNLETANRKSMWNYNVGNITTDGKDKFDFFDDLTTKEQISPGVWKKMNLKYRAYPNLEAGVKDYLNLLNNKHYAGAFQYIVHPDPVAYSKALKARKYYTADESAYTAGVKRLFNQANKSNSYELAMSGQVPRGIKTKKIVQPNKWAFLDNILEKFMNMLSLANSNISLKQLYKTALPNHQILIKINAPNHMSGIEFSRILCLALDEELLASCYPHTDGHQVEVECSLQGPEQECFQAVEQLSQAIAEAFYQATTKVGNIKIETQCSMNKQSSYQPISLKMATTNYRKFLLQFV